MKKRYNVMLNPKMVEILDSLAENEGISRSRLLCEAVLFFIRNKDIKVDNAERNEDIEGQERLW